MNVVDKIQHYQRSIERCNNNETKTLHCIDRLYKLPVTVQHLQETGVGRTVNALRKFDGSVGDAAKALVAKWKTMVVDEESSGEDEDEACVPDASEGYSDRSNSPKFDGDNGDDRHAAKHRSNDSREKGRSEKHDSSRHGTKHSSSSENSKPRENDYKSTKNGTDKSHDSKIEARSELKVEKKSKSSRDSKREISRYDADKETSSSHKSRNKSEDARKNSSKVSSSSGSGTSKNSTSSQDSQRKRKNENSPSERETSKRRRSIESPTIGDDYEDPDEIATQILPRDSDDEATQILPDTSIESDSDEDIPKIKIEPRILIKRETPESPPSNDRGSANSEHSVKTEKSSKHKSRESSSKSTSSSSDKSRRESEKHEKTKSDKSSVDHRKNEKRKDEDRIPSKESSSKSRKHSSSSSSSKDQVTNKHKDKESSSSKRESRSDSDSRDSKETFKEPKEKKNKKVKKKKINRDGGIDCNSGASFAEALGMCTDRPVTRKKATPVSPSSPIIKTIKSEPGTSSSSSSSSSSSLTATSSGKSAVKIKIEPQAYSDPQPLPLLAPNVKLQPLNVDLASTLPEISPNYKPLPSQYTNPVHRKQEEARALSDVIFTKTQRTKVYSGNKAGYTTVPSLYDMCLRVLMENIDGLGFTGGIPYDILKPVLERATADQLFTLENYNPYLIEDTDPLWEFHCNKEFRKFNREELDSWRDTYMRCRDEREVKLRNITASIKESIDKSVPVRSAKLAYVDNVVKPPRNVLRKQAKYGTAKTSSSDIKKKLILSGGSNSATNISVPPPPSARIKTSSSSGVLKKNKAPLMAKALQLIKGRYKR